MVLTPYLTEVSLLTLLSTLPMGLCPQYLTVVLGLLVVLPPVGAACGGPPAGLRFGPFVHWEGELSEPWLLGTTTKF